MNRTYNVIGLMSGTSLDGLDIAFCEFRIHNDKWDWNIITADTVSYDHNWIRLLKEAPNLDGLSLSLLNTSYGHWIGQTVNEFIKKKGIKPQLIASHGHTVFHRPHEKMTLQIGSGAAIAAETRTITISDFRSLNVALGGEGAPLVPIGDKLLFGEFDACLNLGGFANISVESSNQRIAYDICPVNIVLNYLAGKIGLPFDPEGTLALKGSLNNDLLSKLENLEFYNKQGPRSLGREWVESTIIPIIEQSGIGIKDILCTFNHHIASQISRNLPTSKVSKVVFTGGGTYNSFLISLLKKKSYCQIVIPSDIVINFKEALIFAFLGVLRMEGLDNCLAGSTGSSCDCSGGAVHLPPMLEARCR